MIGHLSGQLFYKGFDHLIVDVGGVGYRVEVPLSTLGRLPGVAQSVTLFVHTYVREDAIRLFGFETRDGLILFERLIGVSGVGPRLALAALSHLDPEALQRAVIHGDVARLTQVSGIGKKTAERIVVDLAEPLSRLSIGGQPARNRPASRGSVAFGQLEEGLRYLGYKPRDIQRVLRELGAAAADEDDVEALLKRALKLLQ